MKHLQNLNHKMRIVMFVDSPVEELEKAEVCFFETADSLHEIDLFLLSFIVNKSVFTAREEAEEGEGADGHHLSSALTRRTRRCSRPSTRRSTESEYRFFLSVLFTQSLSSSCFSLGFHKRSPQGGQRLEHPRRRPRRAHR